MNMTRSADCAVLPPAPVALMAMPAGAESIPPNVPPLPAPEPVPEPPRPDDAPPNIEDPPLPGGVPPIQEPPGRHPPASMARHAGLPPRR